MYGIELKNQVIQLTREFGQELTFRRPSSGGTYDPTTSSVSGAENDDETVLAVVSMYDVGEIEQNLIQLGDRKIIMGVQQANGDPLLKTPKAGDEFLGVGDGVTVVSVRTYELKDTVVGYLCQVRE